MIYRKWIQINFFLEPLQQNIFIHTEKPTSLKIILLFV